MTAVPGVHLQVQLQDGHPEPGVAPADGPVRVHGPCHQLTKTFSEVGKALRDKARPAQCRASARPVQAAHGTPAERA